MQTGRLSAASIASQVEKFLAQSAKPKPLQLLYASTSTWPLRDQNESEKIQVGVLDSSFNPPHRAHSALATSQVSYSTYNETSRARSDAILLLYSIRNADKGTGTSKDASTIQRLSMMDKLAQDLEREHGANVAVGIVEEPLMIAKSTLVHHYVQGKHPQLHQGSSSSVRLHWLVGFDTLERFFQVKYYPSPEFFQQACHKFFEQEGTTFVCARRGSASLPNKPINNENSSQQEEEALLQSDIVRPWVERGSVTMIELEPNVQGISSTAIRNLVIQYHSSADQLREKLHPLTTKGVTEYLVNHQVYGKEEQPGKA